MKNTISTPALAKRLLLRKAKKQIKLLINKKIFNL